MHDQVTDKDLTSTVQAMIMRCMHDQRQEGVVSDKCCVALSTLFSKSKFMEVYILVYNMVDRRMVQPFTNIVAIKLKL